LEILENPPAKPPETAPNGIGFVLTMATMMIRILVLILLGVSLMACTTMPQSRAKAASNGVYLLDSAQGDFAVRDVVEDLDRTIETAGVAVSALPLSGTLLEIEAKDKAYKEGLAKKDLDILLATTKKLNKDKVCFSIDLYSGNKDGVNLKYWGVELIDQHLNKYSLTFLNPDAKPDSDTQTHVSGYSDPGYFDGINYYPGSSHIYSYNTTHHSNVGMACTAREKDMDFSKNFAIRLMPRFERGLHPVDLAWLQSPQTPEEMAAVAAEKNKRTRSGPGIP